MWRISSQMSEEHFSLNEDQILDLIRPLTALIEKIIQLNFFPCILLSGELGTGKTTLVREWLKQNGSDDSANSPTFSLHNLYDCKGMKVHHFDLFRIKSEYEVDELGFDEVWGKEGITFIEWWKNAENKIPKQGLVYIDIEHNTLENRIYKLKSDYL
jgi:tRNA threonylcarbamoyladenosine biosynthesis protein TsaE